MEVMYYYFWMQQYCSRGSGYDAARAVMRHVIEASDDCHDNSAYAHAYLSADSYGGGSHYGGLHIIKYNSSEIIRIVSSGSELPVSVPRNIPSEWMHVKVLRSFTDAENVGLSFNLNSPIDVVLDQVEVLVKTIQRFGPNFTTSDYAEGLRILEAQRFVQEHGGFSPASGKARAAGLWLWDRVQEIGESSGVPAKVVREFRASKEIQMLGLEDVEDSDLRFYLRRTSECIEKPGVLSFSKKGTRKRRQVPGT